MSPSEFAAAENARTTRWATAFQAAQQKRADTIAAAALAADTEYQAVIQKLSEEDHAAMLANAKAYDKARADELKAIEKEVADHQAPVLPPAAQKSIQVPAP